MAKFKPAGSKRSKTKQSNRGLVPCLIILLLGFALVFWLLHAMLTSGT